MRILMLLAAAALVGGCEGEPPKPRQVVRKDRIEAAEQRLGKTPVPRTYRYQDGELRVLQVPTVSSYGTLQLTPCFIWRDTEFHTAAIQCPIESSTVDLAGPEDDRSRY